MPHLFETIEIIDTLAAPEFIITSNRRWIDMNVVRIQFFNDKAPRSEFTAA